MADFFTNYAQPQQRTSLADMVNAASGIQNFQQAQQLQPLQLQKAQLELQQAQQMNPLQLQEAQAKLQTAQQGAQKGGIELSQAEQANRERIAMQVFMSNPQNFQTNGEVDQEKINKAIPGLAPMTGTKYIEDLTKLAKSQTEAASAKNQLTTQERGIFGATFLEKANNKVTDPEEYKKSLDDIAEQYDSKHVKRLAETYKNSIDLVKNPAMLPQIAGKIGLGMMAPKEAQEIAAPKVGTIDLGNIVQPTATSNIPGQAPRVQPIGQALPKEIAPQVFANPITGQPTILGGGGANVNRGMGNVSPVAAAGVSSNMPVAQPSSGQFGGGGQLAQQPNESPANFNARVAQTQGLYSSALDQYNNPNSAAGHIPTAQNLNNNILNLLKDPSVRTGSISDYLANKTNKGALNAKEQELTKYLEQRIQGLAPRSDADAISMKNAFGSFNLDKEALKDIVRNDNAFVTSRDLLAKGILHNGANPLNPNNPNYGNVSNFVNRFTPYSSDPTLMKYISIVGEKQKAKVDEDDKNALAKVIGRLSPAERSALEAKRQELLQLVNGGR